MSQIKPLSFSIHAEVSIAERALDRAWIETTVRQPERTIPDPHRPGVERRSRAITEFGGRVLRVACLDMAPEIRIVTVFFDRGARRRP